MANVAVGSAAMTTRRLATRIASAYRRRQLPGRNFCPARTASHYRRQAIPSFRTAVGHGDRVALRDADGEYTYAGLAEAARRLAADIAAVVNRDARSALQNRVALAMGNDASYLIALWACWISGQIAVPISPNHPSSLIEHIIADSRSGIIMTSPEFEADVKDVVAKAGCRLYVVDDAHRRTASKGDCNNNDNKLSAPAMNPYDIGLDADFYARSDALIMYTAGTTTGSPRGVVLNFANIESQVRSLVDALGWDKKGSVLHVLPLNTVYGTVDVLLCPLSVGARCVMMKEFDSAEVWAELLGVNRSGVGERVNRFAGVARMYDSLIRQYQVSLSKSEKMTAYIRSTCTAKIRLMTCISSPLPSRIHDRWEEITGHTIVEQYATTETGTVFSTLPNDTRRRGSVGHPLPGVYTRLISDVDGRSIIAEGSHLSTRRMTTGDDGSSIVDHRLLRSSSSVKPSARPIGRLEVKGDGVSHRYSNGREDDDVIARDWFDTGDIVEYDGAYRILGKASTEVVTTGGFTVSAVEIETALADNESIGDVAVVPLEDAIWGYKLAALVVLKDGDGDGDDGARCRQDIATWAKRRLAEHQLPAVFKFVESIPKNACGKLDRTGLAKRFFAVADDKRHRRA